MPAFVDGQRYEKQRFSGLVERGVRYTGVEFEECAFERSVLAGMLSEYLAIKPTWGASSGPPKPPSEARDVPAKP